MSMPKAADAKTHATHAEAMAHHGQNPNGIHGSHLNIEKIRAGSRAAEAAFDAGEYALLDIVDIDLGGGIEGTMFVKKKM